jgi:muramoyltetrapeptide carboxypeptidase
MPGRATGRLVVALPGIYRTVWQAGVAPALAGAIWCLDTYRDTPERVTGWLGELAAGGALAGLAGLVLARPWARPEAAAAVEAAVLAATAALDPAPPVLADADTGHTWPRWTLPNGALATLDSDADRFSLDEPAVT